MDITLDELEAFFNCCELPSSLNIGKHTKIPDLRFSIDSHLIVAREREGVPAFSSFKNRLIELKIILEDQALKTT